MTALYDFGAVVREGFLIKRNAKTRRVVEIKNTFLDARLDWVDTVHFPDSLSRYPLKGKGFYRLQGKVVDDFGVCSVEVSSMTKIGYKERKYANL